MSEIYSSGSIAGPPAAFMGPYNSGTSYSIGQAASSCGSSYVSLVAANVGCDPATSPTQWALLASAGANGVAGVAGTNGTNGPAGSQGSVTALASAILPAFTGHNLFDLSKVINAQVNAADGTLTGGGPNDATAPIYCPGATSMVSNLPINANSWGGGVCLYDANGTFLSALPATEFTISSGAVYGGTAFALPGSQVYVRLGYVVPWMAGNSRNWVQTDATGMIYATTAGTATLPGTYQPSGMATVSAMVAGDAAQLSSLNTSALALIRDLGSIVLPFNANRFDPSKAQVGYQANLDGTVSISALPGAPITTGMIYCPGDTTLVLNTGIYCDSAVQLFDATGAFMGLAPYNPPGGDWHGPAFTPLTILPGTQTFVRFTVASESGPLPAGGMVLTGSATSIASLTSATLFYPFAGVPPVNQYARQNVKRASELGCALNCDFSSPGIDVGNGRNAAGVIAVNDTAPLNAFLAMASETNPIKLILDGCAYVTGLVISPAGYTIIEGIGRGSGIYMMDGSNQDAIRIGAYTAATGLSEGAYNIAPPPRAATKIALRNFTINNNNSGNSSVGGTYAPANTPVAGAIAHSLHATILANCTDAVVEGMNYINAPWFNLMISNASDIMVRGCEFTSTGYGRDGIHIDGKCEDITISDCAFATGDDAIALNAPEGYGGDISRVTITNCRFLNALTALRIYTSLDAAAIPSNNVHKVRNVVMSNCTGSVATVVFSFGITNGGLSSTTDVDQIQDFRVSNCSFIAPQGLALLLVPIGSISFHDVTFIPASTSPVVNIFFSSVGELELRGLRVLRNADGNAAPASVVFLYSAVAMDRVSILNFAVVDEEGSSYAAVPCILDNGGGTIAALRLEGVDMSHVTALVSSSGWGGVAALRGGGVVGTGVAVPDSVMDNNALYLSSTASGAPSIKVGGVAKRFTLA